MPYQLQYTRSNARYAVAFESLDEARRLATEYKHKGYQNIIISELRSGRHVETF